MKNRTITEQISITQRVVDVAKGRQINQIVRKLNRLSLNEVNNFNKILGSH